MPAPISPAARLLKESGVRSADVAVVANRTAATVSRWLAGQRQHPEQLGIVLERFLDPADARAILDAIPQVQRD